MKLCEFSKIQFELAQAGMRSSAEYIITEVSLWSLDNRFVKGC